MVNLSDFNDFFEKRYSKLNQRFETMKMAFELYLERNGKTIVETGCQREKDDWGAGMSTTIFGELLKRYNCGKLFSVDITPRHIEICQSLTVHVSEKITYALDDSKNFLAWFEEPIDFLYLDSFDWYPKEPLLSQCQQHMIDEFLAAQNKLHSKTIILLDDADLPGGGKTKKLEEMLPKFNWKCVLKKYQSLWILE